MTLQLSLHDWDFSKRYIPSIWNKKKQLDSEYDGRE
jgi:hypothetical protein